MSRVIAPTQRCEGWLARARVGVGVWLGGLAAVAGGDVRLATTGWPRVLASGRARRSLVVTCGWQRQGRSVVPGCWPGAARLVAGADLRNGGANFGSPVQPIQSHQPLVPRSTETQPSRSSVSGALPRRIRHGSAPQATERLDRIPAGGIADPQPTDNPSPTPPLLASERAGDRRSHNGGVPVEPPPTSVADPDAAPHRPRRAGRGRGRSGAGDDARRLPGRGVSRCRCSDVLGWFSPDPRAVLPVDGVHVSRSLARSRRRFEVRIDTAFAEVVAACGDPARPGGWITPDMIEAYALLHTLGWAHSVEVWSAEGTLAGGLFGIAIGGLFAAESKFHRDTDASKVAVVALAELVGAAGDAADRVIDVQWSSDHLATLGVVEIVPSRSTCDGCRSHSTCRRPSSDTVISVRRGRLIGCPPRPLAGPRSPVRAGTGAGRTSRSQVRSRRRAPSSRRSCRIGLTRSCSPG